MTARDGGDEPRVATATATVMVLDLSDEAPKFSQAKYVADVPENSIDYVVSQVQVSVKLALKSFRLNELMPFNRPPIRTAKRA